MTVDTFFMWCCFELRGVDYGEKSGGRKSVWIWNYSWKQIQI